MNPQPRPNSPGRRPVQKPTAAPIQVPRRMAAPKHLPAVPIIEQKSTFGRWCAIIVIGTAGFFVWRFYGDKLNPRDTAEAETQNSPAIAEPATPATARGSAPIAFAKPAGAHTEPNPHAPP